MVLFRIDETYDFMRFGKAFFAVSMVALVLSIGMFLFKGLNLGIDFAGGTVVQVKYDQAAPIDSIRQKMAGNALFEKGVVNEFGSEDEVLIKAPLILTAVGEDVGDMAGKMLQGTGNFEIRRVDMVGPKVGSELKEKGIMSLLLACVAIMLYVGMRYEWRFAVAAIVALVHDIFITAGALIAFGIDVNLEVIAALLTILGYSINDTIIVFDRVRESVRENRSTDLTEIINEAVSRTLGRTTMTSLTVLFVVWTLYMFGGEIILGFSFPLLVGVIVGTYSSIFIASQVVKFLGFSPLEFRRKEAEHAKRKAEKDKIRKMYEKGVV